MSGCATTSVPVQCNCICHGLARPVAFPECCPCRISNITITSSNATSIETLVRLDKLEKEVEVACLWRKNAIACLDRLEEKVSKFLVELDAFASPHFDHDDFRELKSQIYKAESQIRINNDSLTGYAYALEERIKQLEKLNQQCFEANPIAAIDKRFQELEGKIKKLEGQQEFTSALLNAHVQVSKIPYKCPLCDGIGKKMKYEIHVDGEPVGNSYQPENCLSCEGKGIVWA